jgi:nicotinamide-nucleotide amidase
VHPNLERLVRKNRQELLTDIRRLRKSGSAIAERQMDKKELQEAVTYLSNNQLKLVTAESCTAGMLASTLAELPGCGEWLESAFVTYSEDAKIDILDVPQELIDRFGLTSEEVASAMAEGALNFANANLAISTTGVAGPSAGDGEEKVGTVCIAWSFKHISGIQTFSEKTHFPGDRNAVRAAATRHALQRIRQYHEQLSEQV